MKRWRMLRKCCALFLCGALLAGLLPSRSWAADGGEVRYYCDAEGVRHEVPEPATVIEESIVEWNAEDNGTWYVVEQDVTLTERVEVMGSVNLLLCDGATLTVERGIHVAGKNALTVYGQEAGTGKLTGFSAVPEYGAGIGGNYDEDAGVLAFNGGVIKGVQGGATAAGIGGGDQGDGGTITVDGLAVLSATGGKNGGAGIGAGKGHYCKDTITITGGQVTAIGSKCGGGVGSAGIGGSGSTGQGQSGGDIIISGGYVYAKGGQGEKGQVRGDGDGIGNGGNYSDSATTRFYTTSEGNPIIFAEAGGENGSAITDISGKSNESWRGIVFENGAGCVYGDLTLVADLTIDEGQTLEIPEGVTLTVTEDVTLTNNGDIIGSGTIVGTVQGTPPQESVTVDDGKVVITVAVSPSEGGTVQGAGTFDKGDVVTLEATPDDGYHFVSWKEGEQALGEDAAYTFTADTDRHLCAVFAPHVWQDGVCTGCGVVCMHSGGAATCEERAMCERCGERYGNLVAHILQYQSRVEPTYSAPGKMAHYACSVCAACFLDADASQPVRQADLVIPCKEWPQPDPERGNVVLEAVTHGSATVSPEKPRVGAVVTVCAEPAMGYVTESVRALDDAGELLAVKQHADGRYTFLQPRGEVRVQVVFVPMPLPFADVAAGDWFYTPVHDVFARGLMTGVDDDTFAPQMPTTRAMVVSVLARLSTVPQSGACMSMTDVQEGDWYADAVAWALEAGVAHGFEDGSFRPNEAISREQLAAMFYNFAVVEGVATAEQGNVSAFTDAESISPWAHDALSWAVGADLLQGTTPHLLQPQGLATRAQLAALLVRYAENLAHGAL